MCSTETVNITIVAIPLAVVGWNVRLFSMAFLNSRAMAKPASIQGRMSERPYSGGRILPTVFQAKSCEQNMPFSTLTALSIEVARKNTQATTTKSNVRIRPAQRCIFIPRSFQARCTVIAVPCRPPQMTNVQPAPCQRPLTRKVAIRLK